MMVATVTISRLFAIKPAAEFVPAPQQVRFALQKMFYKKWVVSLTLTFLLS